MSHSEDLVTTLKEFGIEREETMFYITLLQSGPSTVHMLAAKLGTERGKAYRILHKLQNLGMVSTTFSNPTLCTIVDPKQALGMLINKKEDEILSLKKLVPEIVKDLENFKNSEYDKSQLPSFYIVQGRSNVYGRIGKMIEESKKAVYISTTMEDATRMYHTSIPEKIKEAVVRGVQVNLLVDTRDPKLLGKIGGLNAESIRTGKLPSESRTVILPDSILMMSGKMNKSMSLNDDVDSVLYTNSLEFIKNMEKLFWSLWDNAKNW